jgi:predicted nucleotidyltransferase
MTTARIPIPYEPLAAFCRRWRITDLALFGSVLRDDFRPDSDVDILVRLAPGHRWTLFDLADMEAELEAIFGQPVDLTDWEGIEQSPNYIRRKQILSTIEPVYAAGR